MTYPEYKNRNGKITANFLSGLFDLANKQAVSMGHNSLRDYFESGGFDTDTFTISINSKLGQTQNLRSDGRENY